MPPVAADRPFIFKISQAVIGKPQRWDGIRIGKKLIAQIKPTPILRHLLECPSLERSPGFEHQIAVRRARMIARTFVE